MKEAVSQLTCMAALYASTVRPAFSCLTSGFSRTVNGFVITLPAPPVLTKDQTGMVKDVKLALSVTTPTNTLIATVHLHNTTCGVHVQGSSPVSFKPGAGTAAEWLTEVFIIPRIQHHMESNKTDSAKLAAINTAQHRPYHRLHPALPGVLRQLRQQQDGLLRHLFPLRR